jgi:hypothetical protein
MPPPFPDAHAQGERPVSQAPRRRTAQHRSGSSPAHQRQGTEPPRLPRLDGCSALEPTHRNEKHLLGSKSKLLPSQITSISHLLLPSGDYLSRLPKQLRTPLRAELTRPNSKRVPPFLFARLTTDRLCTSLSASSRRCLLQEWRSYIVGYMFCHSPFDSLLRTPGYTSYPVHWTWTFRLEAETHRAEGTPSQIALALSFSSQALVWTTRICQPVRVLSYE